MTDIITREDAIARGYRTYFTGTPCPHGHIAERRVKGYRCMECRRADKAREQKREAWRARKPKEREKYESKPENKMKKEAHTRVLIAVRSGKLIKQPCERCGASNRVVAHHEDYTKPLDVNWLCEKHHKQRHKELAQAILNKYNVTEKL